MAFSLINLIWVGCVLGVLGVFAGWPRAGGIAFLAAILFAPIGVFGAYYVRIELVLVPLLLGLQALNGLVRWPTAIIPAVAWLVVVAVVSFLGSGDVHFIGLYGLSRFVAVCLIFSSICYREWEFLKAQELFVLSAIPMGLLCLGQVFGVSGARWLTEFAYYTPEQAVFDEQIEAEDLGCVFRAQAVFGNISPTSTYFVAVIGVGVILLAEYWRRRDTRRRNAMAVSLVAALAGGTATFSATFVAGVFPILAGAAWLSPAKQRKLALAAVATIAAVAIGMAWATISRSESLGTQIAYQWDRLIAGEAIEGRYSYREGVLAEAYEEVRENLVFGRGAKVTTTFVGDSLYMMVLYTGGIVGSLLLLTAVAMMAQRSLRAGLAGRIGLVWTLAVLVCGVGAGGVFILRFGDWWWATQGMLLGLVGGARSADGTHGDRRLRRDESDGSPGQRHRGRERPRPGQIARGRRPGTRLPLGEAPAGIATAEVGRQARKRTAS